jgi:hypothetical protein
VFLYGFAKNERENEGLEELTELRKVGQNWLSASPQKIAEALVEELLQEVVYGNEKEIKPA